MHKLNLKLTLLFAFFVLSSCSTVNQPYRDEFQATKNLRHGIIPLEQTAPKKEHQKGEVLAYSDPAAIERGKVIYQKNCVECHGPQGMGDGPSALKQAKRPADLRKTVQDVPYFKFFVSVSKMQGAMPGWKTPYSQNELNDLTAYLLTLK